MTRHRPSVLQGAVGRLRGALPRPLLEQVAPSPPETDRAKTRRRRVVAVTGLTGATLLSASLSSRPGSRRFLVLTFATALTWTGGALGSGPLHRGWIEGRDNRFRRPVATPIATGAAAFGLFYLAALVARRIPLLDRAIVRVLAHAHEGATPAVVLTTCANGAAEELFFRGALYRAAEESRPVALSSATYLAATAATGNPALTLAGAAMGVLFGLQRRASGGVQAPILTHLTWSLLMLRKLPPLFRAEEAPRPERGARPFTNRDGCGGRSRR